LKKVPFDLKVDFSNQYKMSIGKVKIIFKNPWSVPLFEQLAKTIEPQLIFEWVYEHILGNCIKKDLDFKTILTE
jgi:Asp-tRNA(Asn)/Glu-tRNA(Gln) amidotransferase B subunit